MSSSLHISPLAAVALLTGATLSSFAGETLPLLDPTKPPSANFDLTYWYLGVPISADGRLGDNIDSAEIQTPDLSSADYYSREPYKSLYSRFFYSGTDGAMVFEVPHDGANTSGAPRCELRETHPDGSHFNWTPDSNGGVHTLDGVCAINAIGKGKISFGQIHAKSINVPTVMLRYDNTESPPVIYVTVKHNADAKSPRTRFDFPAVGLDEPISYQLKMEYTGTSVMFSCTVNGDTRTTEMTARVWLTATQYFKAGNYYTVQEEGVTAKVSFYKLVARHSELPKSGNEKAHSSSFFKGDRVLPGRGEPPRNDAR
jgi:hypothetical protein